MRHLTESEFTDLIDGHLAPSRMAHLGMCPDCTARLDALRSALDSLHAAGGGAPSPLFWSSFPGRVAAAIDEQPESGWWFRPRVIALAGLAAAVVVAAVLALVASRGWTPAEPTAPVVNNAPDALVPGDDLDRDPAWAAVRTAADALDYDEALAAGISASPGAAERAAMELSDEQRAELIRLIEREIKRAGGA